MTDDKDLKEVLERTPQPFAAPDLDTWTAAWAVSRRGKVQRKTDADDRVGEPAKKPSETSVPDPSSEKAVRKTETPAFGPVLDTFTVAWAASKRASDGSVRPEAAEPDNAAIVRDIYTRFPTAAEPGDVPAILAGLSAEVDWQSPGPAEIPWAGTVRGRAWVAEWFARREETCVCERRIPTAFIAQGNQVVVTCDERLRFVLTGRCVELTVTAVWTLSRGVVTRYRESYDTAALAAALRAD